MKYKTHILAFLSKNRLMSLATSSKNKPWAATVFFAYDKNCNILFYSREDTKHCRDIAKNPNVALTFNQWNGKPNSIKGLQIAGRASKIPKGRLNLPRWKVKPSFYSIYRNRYPWADKFKSDHTLYIVHPKEIHYIDQELFGHFFGVQTLPSDEGR
jgi:uncharacterized protein YhbP (UPF0306 family)